MGIRLVGAENCTPWPSIEEMANRHHDYSTST
jgi:hypothetical protein